MHAFAGWVSHENLVGWPLSTLYCTLGEIYAPSSAVVLMQTDINQGTTCFVLVIALFNPPGSVLQRICPCSFPHTACRSRWGTAAVTDRGAKVLGFRFLVPYCAENNCASSRDKNARTPGVSVTPRSIREGYMVSSSQSGAVVLTIPGGGGKMSSTSSCSAASWSSDSSPQSTAELMSPMPASGSAISLVFCEGTGRVSAFSGMR